MTSVQAVLAAQLPQLDEETLDYFCNIISDHDDWGDTIASFLISYAIAEDDRQAYTICEQLKQNLNQRGLGSTENASHNLGECVLLDKVVSLGGGMSADEQARVDSMWGFDKIREKLNTTLEVNESGSAKFERKVEKEQRKWLENLEAKFVGDDDHTDAICTMTLPDYSNNCNERDIHVDSITLSYGGQILLEDAQLRLAFGRRYGIVGKPL